MEPIHEGLPEVDFEKPPDVTTASVCKMTGDLASDFDRAVGTAHTEFYRVDTIPTQVCNGVHSSSYNFICGLTGQAASETCPFRVAGTPINAGWCPHSLDATGAQRTDAVPSGYSGTDTETDDSDDAITMGGGEENGDIGAIDQNLLAALLAQQQAAAAAAGTDTTGAQ